MTSKHIDHIDPQQGFLVSGFDVPNNYCERETSFNISKGNRFLPYRGSAPVDEGEHHWFLNPDNEQWEWQPFLGEWWFEKSKRYDARVISNKTRHKTGLVTHHPNFHGKPWKLGHPRRHWNPTELEERVLFELRKHKWSYHWGRGKLQKELNVSEPTLKRITSKLRKQWKHS